MYLKEVYRYKFEFLEFFMLSNLYIGHVLSTGDYNRICVYYIIMQLFHAKNT